jgi:hypothetical protein
MQAIRTAAAAAYVGSAAIERCNAADAATITDRALRD